MRQGDRIAVVGSDTSIGSAICRALLSVDYNLISDSISNEPDYTNYDQVDNFFLKFRPTHVFVAMGDSGGISANLKYPAQLMLNNLISECNVISAAHKYDVRKLLFIASSCVYPRLCTQPMKEMDLLTGPLEPTNESYALAKLAGIKLCQAYNQEYANNFISCIPSNQFGPGDDFDLNDSHVIPALIRKMHEAKYSGDSCVEIWGTGTPEREFIYVDDLADACVLVMNQYDGQSPINLGSGTTLSIGQLARTIREVVGYEGCLKFNSAKPDGMPLKSLDNRKLRGLGWTPNIEIEDALNRTYSWYLKEATEFI